MGMNVKSYPSRTRQGEPHGRSSNSFVFGCRNRVSVNGDADDFYAGDYTGDTGDIILNDDDDDDDDTSDEGCTSLDKVAHNIDRLLMAKKHQNNTTDSESPSSPKFKIGDVVTYKSYVESRRLKQGLPGIYIVSSNRRANYSTYDTVLINPLLGRDDHTIYVNENLLMLTSEIPEKYSI